MKCLIHEIKAVESLIMSNLQMTYPSFEVFKPHRRKAIALKLHDFMLAVFNHFNETSFTQLIGQ